MVEPDARTAFDAAAERLGQAGVRMRKVTLPKAFDTLADAQRVVMACEATRNYAYETDRRSEQLRPQFRALTTSGWSIPRRDYLASSASIQRVEHQLPLLCEGVDAWLSPSAMGELRRSNKGPAIPS